MNARFLHAQDKKKLLAELESQFGITKLPYLLLETGKDKIRAFSGSMTREEIVELSKLAHIEIIGLYTIRREGQLRLSMDGAQMLADDIEHHVVEVDDKQAEAWLQGQDLLLAEGADPGVFVLKHNQDIIGCGKSDGKKMWNFVPKERRIRRS